MNTKTIVIAGATLLIVGAGVFVGLGQLSGDNTSDNQKIDWKAEADKMFTELQKKENAGKIDWQAEADRMLDELSTKNSEGEIDWLSENDKMLAELVEQNKTDGIDWQAEADRMFEELQNENKIDWQKETERMMAELEGLNGDLDDTGLESDAANLETELKTSSYVGTWRKTATYINGKAEGHAVSTLVLTKNTYEAKTTCLVSGKLSATGDKMSINIVSDACTAGMGPKNYAFDYLVSRDSKILTLTYAQPGFTMKEVFERVK